MAVRTNKRKVKKSLPKGIINIHTSYNNTIISISNENGDIFCWSSPGALGFKGSRKSTPFAAQQASRKILDFATELGLKAATVVLRGRGAGKDAALKTFQASEIELEKILDYTPKAHNGCRLPKRERQKLAKKNK